MCKVGSTREGTELDYWNGQVHVVYVSPPLSRELFQWNDENVSFVDLPM